MGHIKVICDTNIISGYISGNEDIIKEIDKIV